MSAPNVLALTTIVADTAYLAATNTETDLIGAVATGHVYNVGAIFAANVHASVVGWVSVWLKKSGTEHQIANQTRIPVKTTINILLGKSVYLAEGDSIRVQANQSSNVAVAAPFENMS